MYNSKENDKKEPAPWNPIELSKFNKNTEEISEIFKSDSERMNGDQKSNYANDKKMRNNQYG